MSSVWATRSCFFLSMTPGNRSSIAYPCSPTTLWPNATSRRPRCARTCLNEISARYEHLRPTHSTKVADRLTEAHTASAHQYCRFGDYGRRTPIWSCEEYTTGPKSTSTRFLPAALDDLALRRGGSDDI